MYSPGPRPGPTLCGCQPCDGESCRECDGTAAEEIEIRRNPGLALDLALWWAATNGAER